MKYNNLHSWSVVRPRIDPKMEPKIDPTSTPNLTEIVPKSNPNRPQIDPESTPERTQIDPQFHTKSIPNRPRIDPISNPNRSKIEPTSTPFRLPIGLSSAVGRWGCKGSGCGCMWLELSECIELSAFTMNDNHHRHHRHHHHYHDHDHHQRHQRQSHRHQYHHQTIWLSPALISHARAPPLKPMPRSPRWPQDVSNMKARKAQDDAKMIKKWKL